MSLDKNTEKKKSLIKVWVIFGYVKFNSVRSTHNE